MSVQYTRKPMEDGQTRLIICLDFPSRDSGVRSPLDVAAALTILLGNTVGMWNNELDRLWKAALYDSLHSGTTDKYYQEELDGLA